MDEIYWTAQQVQWFYSISAPTLGEWVKSGFPKDGRNKYPAKAGYEWIKKNILHTEGIEGNINEEKLLHERAKRRVAELKAEQMAGNLVPKDQAMEWLSLLVGNAKAHLWGLPKRLAGPMSICTDPRGAEERMRTEIRAILEDMGRPLKKAKPARRTK